MWPGYRVKSERKRKYLHRLANLGGLCDCSLRRVEKTKGKGYEIDYHEIQ